MAKKNDSIVLSVSNFPNALFDNDPYENIVPIYPHHYEINPFTALNENSTDFVTSSKITLLPQTTEEIPLQDIRQMESMRKFLDQLSMDYKTDYPRRGKALIFNHRKFKDRDLAPRNGTELDEQLFVKTLLVLGFAESDIHVYRDLNMANIEDILHTVAKKIDHTCYDMFLCAMFTHGERNRLYAYDGIYPVSTLWKYFTEDECPSLKGKPKLYFIQACRGVKLDDGQKVRHEKATLPSVRGLGLDKTDSKETTTSEISDVMDSKETTSTSALKLPESNPVLPETNGLLKVPDTTSHNRSNSDRERKKLTRRQGMRKTSLPCNVLSVPADWHQNSSRDIQVDTISWKDDDETFIPPQNDVDILVATSCADGYYSFRRPSEGSWFIRTWFQVVMEHSEEIEKLDFTELLTEVGLRVGSEQISHVQDPRKMAFDKKKQIPCWNSTLTKRLYFNNIFYSTHM